VGIFQQAYEIARELTVTFSREVGVGWTGEIFLRFGGPLNERFSAMICQGQQDNSLSIE